MTSIALLLKRGRVLRSGARAPQPLDIAIGRDGRIVAVDRAITDERAERTVDLANRLVVPGLVDAHQHLDKSRTRRLVENPTATLEGASAAYRRFAAAATREDIIARAERALEICLARGTVAIRERFCNLLAIGQGGRCLKGVKGG